MVLVAISTTLLGFIAQFVALRQMHSTVTVAQLGAVLAMTVIRSSLHIQRHTSNDIKSPAEIEGHELDRLAKDLNRPTAWHVRSVRVVPASGESTHTPPTRTSERNSGTGHWLLSHLEISWLRKLFTSLEAPQESIALNDVGNVAITVLQIRLASLSQTLVLEDRTEVRILQNAIEAAMIVVYSKMTMKDKLNTATEFKWTIPVQAHAEFTAVANVELTIKRVADQNGGWRRWIVAEGQLEAVYCLWMSCHIHVTPPATGIIQAIDVRLTLYNGPVIKTQHDQSRHHVTPLIAKLGDLRGPRLSISQRPM